MITGPRTRLTEFAAPSDPHPEVDPNTLIDLEALRIAATEVDGTERLELETEVNDRVLTAMADAQRNAVIAAAVAAEPSLEGASPAEIHAFLNELQLDDPARYVDILNTSIANAAAQLHREGITAQSLAGSILRAAQGVGHNLQGAAVDLQGLDTSQILTIAGITGGTFLLSGSAWVTGTAGVLAVAIHSPHLTEGLIATGETAGRGVMQLASLPLKAGIRITDIVNNIGQGDMSTAILNNGQGFARDVVDSIAYTFNGEYDPSLNPDRNPLMEEYLHLGEAFAPAPLVPLLQYLNAIRSGEPLTAADFPSRAELEAAGEFMRQAENLVTPEEFLEIDMRRIHGETLTREEVQKYILGKYCQMVDQAFLSANRLQPQGEVVLAAYRAASTGRLDLNSAVPLPASVDLSAFSWDESQMRQLEHNAQGLMGNITLDTLCNGGFVGLALTAYLTLTIGLGAISGVTSAYRSRGERRETNRERARTPNDNLNLTPSQQESLINKLDNPRSRVSELSTVLKGAGVLVSAHEFDRSIAQKRVEDFSEEALSNFRAAVNTNAGRGAVREAYFAMIQTLGLTEAQQAAMQQRQDYYRFLHQLNQIDLFYRYQPRGASSPPFRVGNREFVLQQPPERGQFEFTTVGDIARGVNPRNWIRSWSNFMSTNGRTIRVHTENGREVQLRLRAQEVGGQMVYQFNAREGDGWENFNMQEFGFTSDIAASA